MFDWDMLITAVVGVLGGSGMTGLFLRKQNKGSATADALDKYAEAMSKILEHTTKQQETFNKIISDKDASIAERDIIIDQNRTVMEEMKAQVAELRLKVVENERKVTGMQRTIDTEIKLRSFAEGNICLREKCEIRIPEKGTYKKEA